MSPEAYLEYATPFFNQVEYLKGYDYKLLATLLQGRTEIFSDVASLTEFMVKFDGFDLTAFENKKWKTDCSLAKEMLPALIELVEKDFDNLHDGLVAFAEEKGYKKGQVLWIFRIAITGSQVTPGGATEMAELFGKEKCIERMKACLARL